MIRSKSYTICNLNAARKRAEEVSRNTDLESNGRSDQLKLGKKRTPPRGISGRSAKKLLSGEREKKVCFVTNAGRNLMSCSGKKKNGLKRKDDGFKGRYVGVGKHLRRGAKGTKMPPQDLSKGAGLKKTRIKWP